MKISKQVIVIRKDLNMRKGKIVAQGSHASLKCILDFGKREPNEMSLSSEGNEELIISLESGSPIKNWLDGIYTKICVSVNSESELLEVYNKAKSKGLICSLVTDVGLTEFNGIPTLTCCAIGPCWSDEVDEITGKLPLL